VSPERHRVRGLDYAVHRWGAAGGTPLVLLHGWMDCGATFAPLAAAVGRRPVLAPDWRGFGDSRPSTADTVWIPDYLADLETLLDRLAPAGQVDLLGHSLGGNIAGLYAGVRPQRVRRVVSVEGFGLPPRAADEAPGRFAEWLDSLRGAPPAPRHYPDIDSLAGQLAQRHPGLAPARAREIAALWTEPAPEGRRLRANAAHWRPNPVLYRHEETLACWQRIRAPVLWIHGSQSRYMAALRALPDWPQRRAAVPDLRLRCIKGAGHAPHLSHPEALAAPVRQFLDD